MVDCQAIQILSVTFNIWLKVAVIKLCFFTQTEKFNFFALVQFHFLINALHLRLQLHILISPPINAVYSLNGRLAIFIMANNIWLAQLTNFVNIFELILG